MKRDRNVESRSEKETFLISRPLNMNEPGDLVTITGNLIAFSNKKTARPKKKKKKKIEKQQKHICTKCG